MQQIQCEECGEPTPGYDIVSYGSMDNGYRQICCRCFNADVAKRSGQDGFEDARFESVVMKDCTGEPHQFHFQTRLLGNIVSLESFELHEGCPSGYQFQIIGDPKEDLIAILGRLIEKMRRALSVTHIVEDGGTLQFADQTLRGRIESGVSEDDRLPLIVVDGREISWNEFGRMLMTFEGWQFKLEILDRSDEP